MIKINNIQATGIEITPAIREYAENKIEALEKFVDMDDTSIAADIEVGKTTEHHQHGDVFRAEINFYIKGEILRAESVKDDLYAAIDEVKYELSRILKERNDRRRKKNKKGGAFLKKILRGFK